MHLIKKISLISLAVFLLSSSTISSQQAQTPASQNQKQVEKQTDKPEPKDINTLLKESIASSQSSLFYILLLAFLAGILTSFTPCVYPMIPITVGLLQTQASQSLTYNFLSAFFYVSGIAIVYATLGYVSATTSMIFGHWVANPWFILFMILLFLYLAFSMFGFYEIYTPQFLLRRREVQGKGSLFYSFLFGLISGSVASPCLTPALAVLLGLAAKTANPFYGFLTLLSFSFGMGTLLILLGTFSSTLTLLPRAGAWMVDIKKAMGFLLLCVCVYFASPLISDNLALQLYAGVTLSAAIYSFLRKPRTKLAIIIGLLLMLAALALFGYSINQYLWS